MNTFPEKRYQELIMAKKEDYYARVQAALSDIKEGNVKATNTAADLLKALGLDETE